jgi:hypothetical protein
MDKVKKGEGGRGQKCEGVNGIPRWELRKRREERAL